MAKTDLKTAILKTDKSVKLFISNLTEVNNKVLYGKSQVPPLENFSDPIARNRFFGKEGSVISKFKEDPSLVNATFVLRNLNSFDLCNPFMFIVSQAIPQDSPVAQAFTNIQSKINQYVAVFEGYNITDGVGEAEADPRDSLLNDTPGIPSIPFATGKVAFNIKTSNKLAIGANVTITQLQDNKVKSSMVGQISQVAPASFAGAQNIEVNITTIFPPNPPTLEDGETLRTFSRFNIEYETKTSADARQLGEDLLSISNEIRNLGVGDVISELNNVPDGIPGVSKLKKVFEDVGEILGLGQATGTVDTLDTAGGVLTGDENLPPAEVIRRVRILRDFYDKIRPYTNLNFAIQSFFEEEIAGINRFLRDAIPYDALAKIVGGIEFIARTVIGVITFIIAILKFISTLLKIITIILKVLRVIIKVIKLVIKAIPSITTTVGVQEKTINGIGGIEETIQQIIDLLEIYQWGVNSTLSQLQLTKRYLIEFLQEGAILQATLESCNGLNGSNLDTIMNQANRNTFNALRALLDSVPSLNANQRFGNDGTGTNNNNTPGTFIRTENGYIIVTNTVFGFDEFGNIVFYGDLVSLSTGVNFENTLGQEFRSGLQYYTFNKFKNLDSAGNLIQKAEKLFLDKQTRVADPEDVFGNFQESYYGYTLKIQEEKRIDPNVQVLVRRRGIALDSNEKIVASTELTFSTDLIGIVQELKIKLNQFVQQGVIGFNTLDIQPNEISDEDAINLAESYGASPIGINNLKANNADNSITDVANGIRTEDLDNIETRIGNEPFSSPSTNNINTTVQGVPVSTPNNTEMQVTGNNSPTNTKKIDLQKLLFTPFNQFINENPSLKNLTDTFSTLNKLSPSQLSKVLSQPGIENLNEEELITKLKSQILSELDPNPEKVAKIQKLTNQFLDALEGVIRVEWEAATRNTPINYRIPFEEYYKRVEDDKIQEFVEGLLRKDFTETEIQLGIGKEEISDKYSIKIEETKVTVRLRSKNKKDNR
jgi:hypothetical protein